jgi:ABC-type glycerol-3-phosphate transport system substrate-binding protein
MTNFQTILLGIFIGGFVFAVLIFSGLINLDSKETSEIGLSGNIVIWGVLPRSYFTEAMDLMSSKNEGLYLKYVEKKIDTYQTELVEAFAKGVGPDIYIISTDMIKENESFVYKIPYTSYPEKNFKSSYVEGADIYLDGQGVFGFPILSDPLVLYYNNNILSNNSIVNPPKTWDELFDLNIKLTKKDGNGIISQSMIALGSYNNVNHAKDILATLLIQNGNNLIRKEIEDVNTVYSSVLRENPLGYSVLPIDATLDFYMIFSNMSSPYYSWNRALPNSLDMFTSGKLAFYIGRASELFKIQSQNPNLSFNVTELPQMKDTNFKRTYAEIYAMVVNKNSVNLSSSVGVAGSFALVDNSRTISTLSSLPPVLRSLLSERPKDNSYLETFFDSVIISRSWLDPNEKKTEVIFRDLIENISSNALGVSDAVNKANSQINLLIN